MEKENQKKKICRFCGHNNYEEKYAKHLNSKHSDIMKKREAIKNLVRTFNSEQITRATEFLLQIRKEAEKN
ncbi:protein of unknown function [endosymbiont DhMRE of Dentiscutata heterogama]|uniref:hypothetical protein n=1 Tax=endosymbiont DhMRE of Dentiscutata heterogama TaxID=1609546 RepID=UPI000629D65A|nr:hypothetical protein [endosymbiont DhMRE of Dentiscutata heterogama]CFW93282.1 protein of unknown function [endosymbiont DhMRE of Dentiscutata heterogama]